MTQQQQLSTATSISAKQQTNNFKTDTSSSSSRTSSSLYFFWSLPLSLMAYSIPTNLTIYFYNDNSFVKTKYNPVRRSNINTWKNKKIINKKELLLAKLYSVIHNILLATQIPTTLNLKEKQCDKKSNKLTVSILWCIQWPKLFQHHNSECSLAWELVRIMEKKKLYTNILESSKIDVNRIYETYL